MKTNWLHKWPKVLIADQSDHCNIILHHILENNHGIYPQNITVLKNWDEVLAATQQELFDLIIINQVLNWTNWLKVAEIIRQNRQGELPQILGYLSCNPENPKDFDDFALKPVSMNEISGKIGKSLDIWKDIEIEDGVVNCT